jgi:uncharacterized membrane protein YbhN (UPF0104 family)
MATSTRDRIRQIVPLVGTVLLLSYLGYTTDFAKLRDALAHADLGQYAVVLCTGAIVAWLYDTACVTWLVAQTLGDQGKPLKLRELLPVKAASYAINAVSYPLATLAISWAVARRKKVAFLEATGALAVLAYLDVLALGGMVAAGLLLAPEVIASQPELQRPVQIATLLILGGGVAGIALVQSKWPWPMLQRLQQLQLLRPIVHMAPGKLLLGFILRVGLLLIYAATNFMIMRSFGMEPQWGRLLVVMPFLTVLGALPLSVSGLGTTQIPMRQFYAPFITDGRPAAPVIDAFSSAMILGYMVVRLVLALPFLRGILQELREKKAE